MIKEYNVIAIITVCFLFVLTSCSAPITEPTTTPTPTAAPTIAPAVEPEPQPTLEQTPDPMQIKFDMAPEIDGLIKEIREKDGILKVVYLYLEDNPYGGVAGEYAGEFKKEVILHDPKDGVAKEVGGIVLDAYVIKKIIVDKMEVGDKRTISVPLDISTLLDTDSIELSLIKGTSLFLGENDGIIKIDCFGQESLPLVNIDPNETTYILDYTDKGLFVVNQNVYEYEGSDDTYFYTRGNDSVIKIKIESRTSSLIIKEGGLVNQEELKTIKDDFDFGSFITDISFPIEICSITNEEQALLRVHFLNVNGVYVFMKSN